MCYQQEIVGGVVFGATCTQRPRTGREVATSLHGQRGLEDATIQQDWGDDVDSR